MGTESNEYDENIMETSTSEIDKKFWDYFDSATQGYNFNLSAADVMPREQGPVLATYGILMAVGSVGNVLVLATLIKTRRRRSRVDMLMTHLAVADVCVTCGVIPLEIGWKYTNAWLAGNFLCKLLLVLRAFGLYLSSNVLVCISIDRFFAVLYPLRLSVARRRSKQMLYCAWAVALACSLPQSIVFRVMRHPHVPGFEQCVSFGAFNTARQEVVYNVFCLCAMYLLPLAVITGCYLCIFCEIHATTRTPQNESRHQNGDPSSSSAKSVRLRRSDRRVLERARRRTLRMTVIIVCVFALCWLPYATITMWYMVDRESASRVSPRIQDLLFAMAVSNSCMNPLVYGTYTLNLGKAVRRLLKNTCCVSTAAASDICGIGSSSTKIKNNNMDTPLVTPSKNGRVKLGVRFAETSLTAAAGERSPLARTPRASA